MANKPHLNLIICGHVDHGKSTSMGHFLFDLGVVDQRMIEEFAKESEKTGAGDSFKYAWVLDELKDERERGVTIDLAFQKF
jgi:elongation factor 1-alpha